MPFTDYPEYDAIGLAALVRRREVRPTELTEAAIERIEAFNPAVNAVVYKAYDQARALAAQQDASEPSGPLFGVPFLLKDILGDCEGWPTTLSSRAFSDRVMPYDCELVSRFKRAGVVFVGKTNTPEFGILPTTEGQFHGPARNPWHLDHSTGGSSGGAAAAVATGMVPIAHGNDGGGSIRIPASCCGVVGLKPTRARNSMAPDFGDLLGGLLDEHALTRTVRDSAALLDATHGPVPGDPYRAPPVSGTFLDDTLREPGRLRVAFSRTDPFGRPLHPDCLAGVDATAKLLESLGHTVEEAQPQIDPQGFVEAFSAMWFAGIAYAIDLVSLQSGRTLQPGDLENLTHAVHARGRAISAVEFQFAELVMQQAGREMGRFHQTYDCWLTPTLATPPLRNGVIDVRESDLEKTYAPLIDYSPFTAIQNASGQPSISLPLHWSGAGLPIGMMFSADAGNEGLLFQLAAQLEQARPWKDRRPGLVLQHGARERDLATA